jgi:hypothetical protein
MFSSQDYLLPARSGNDGIWYTMLPLRFEYRLKKDYFKRNMLEYFDECMIDLDSLGRIEKIGLVKLQDFDYMWLVHAEPDVHCSSVDFVGLQGTMHINKCSVGNNCVTVVQGQSRNFMVIHACSGPRLN